MMCDAINHDSGSKIILADYNGECPRQLRT